MNNKRGGFWSFIVSGIILIILIAGALSFLKLNNIDSIESARLYFKQWSDKTWECKERGDCTAKDFVGENGIINPGGGGITPPKTENPNPEELNTPTPSITEKPKDDTFSILKTLKIEEAQEITYSSKEWKHWTGKPCNVRIQILVSQGTDVKLDESKCKIISGTWVDPYSDKVITESSQIDIDHVIPKSYAARHGGQKWTLEEKEKFSNDLKNLIASSSSENRSKGDKGPSKYMPKDSFKCEYSKIWVYIASEYKISITSEDYKALENGLNKCKN